MIRMPGTYIRTTEDYERVCLNIQKEQCLLTVALHYDYESKALSFWNEAITCHVLT